MNLLIEVAGLPGAGKTTLARTLSASLNDLGYRVCSLPENAEQCPFESTGREWDFNVWTACGAVRDILASRSFEGIRIQDRGVFDARCLLDWSARMRCIPLEVASRVDGFLETGTWGDAPSLILQLTIKPEEAIRRHGGSGRVINPLTLQDMAQSYARLSAQPSVQSQSALLTMDTTRLDRATVTSRALRAIAEFLPRQPRSTT